jgi:hypothetical protein
LAGFVLELARVKEGLLMSLWMSTVWITISISLDMQANASGLGVMMHAAVLVLCMAMWASLQFAWFQDLFPGLCILFERLLFSLAGISAVVLLSWKGITHFGMESAPFVLFVVQHYVFSILSLPRATGFREQTLSGFDPDEYHILSYPESVFALFSYVMLPGLMHLVMFRSVLFSQQHLSSAALMWCLPMLGLLWLWPRKPLWMFYSLPRFISAVRALLIVVSAAVVPAALCYRVIFPSYLDDLPLPQPVTHAVMFVALSLAFLSERISVRAAEKPLLVVVVLCAVAVCVGLAAPWWIFAFAGAAAVALARFYSTRKPLPYLLSLAMVTICLVWFMSSKLAFVSFHFARADLSLSSVLGLLAAVFVGAFLLLGLFLSRQPNQLNDAALLVYSVSFALAEWLLAFGHDADNSGLYPEYLVAVTSLCGMYLCHASASARVISRAGSWSVACVWLAKSAALVCHDSFTADVLALLALWCLAPIAYRWDVPKSAKPTILLFHVAMALVVALVAASSNVAKCVALYVLPVRKKKKK